ncbi:Leucoanthocyanidin dioxygenase [Platanthera guangdongensis]|uniref:Leucoanthocyanidin dioxygenase n=1 Tax=Platanthera guangdongensis TaxID=2320717 RepID=A0ABR2LUG9_9ASPA
MDSLLNEWPEPIVAVQSIAESGAALIPECYVKPIADRPAAPAGAAGKDPGIPVIDLGRLGGSAVECRATMRAIADACREWGFFQAVNHGVDADLIDEMVAVWREFFYLPMEEKKKLANSPQTYEGYGSRLGVEKGAALDWGDYFYLHLLPNCAKNFDKWPTNPASCRKITEKYGRQMTNLCGTLMKVLSISLGLDVGYLQEKFGGDEIGTCMRINYYPKCPQPELTLGLSPHSDPGGLHRSPRRPPRVRAAGAEGRRLGHRQPDPLVLSSSMLETKYRCSATRPTRAWSTGW